MLHLLIDTVIDEDKEWRRHHTRILIFYGVLAAVFLTHLYLK